MSEENKRPVDDFENPNVGEQFGGSYPRLQLNENEASEMVTYTGKDTKIQVEGDNEGETRDIAVHVLSTVKDQVLCTAPIGAIFDNVWSEAKIKVGDKFRIKRYPDTEKAKGKGKGNKMKVYGIKVYERAK